MSEPKKPVMPGPRTVVRLAAAMKAHIDRKIATDAPDFRAALEKAVRAVAARVRP